MSYITSMPLCWPWSSKSRLNLNTCLWTASAGLGLLQYCNLNSFRTKFILGFSFFMGLSVPRYFSDYVITSGHGPVHTHSVWVCNWYPPPICLSLSLMMERNHALLVCSAVQQNGPNYVHIPSHGGRGRCYVSGPYSCTQTRQHSKRQWEALVG